MLGWPLRKYLKAACRHGFMLFPSLILICLALLGNIGQTFGIPQLFTDDVDPLATHPGVSLGWRLMSSAQFSTQVYAVAFVGLLWTLIVLIEEERGARDHDPLKITSKARLLVVIAVATAITSLLPLLAVLKATYMPVHGDLGSHLLVLTFLGAAVGFMFFLRGTSITLAASDLCRLQQLQGVILFSSLVLVALMYLPVILPAKAVFVLSGWFVLAYSSFYLLPSIYRFPALVVLGVVGGLTNSVPEKYEFPGMEKFYDHRISLSRLNSQDARPPLRQARAVACSASVDDINEGNRLIDPIRGLQAWYARQDKTAEGHKPRLVVIATSGGGYRATFWTALLLDALQKFDAHGGPLEGLSESINLLTGASGGMVASAYFVASAAHSGPQATEQKGRIVDLIHGDIRRAQKADQRGLPNPIIGSRDSLSYIVRELIKYDIPAVLLPFRRAHDRGRELETHWGSLSSTTFAEIAEGEREGRLPHLVFSPVLVETGQPLLISNLDLRDVTNGAKEAVELFKLFPDLQSAFRLSTAARMNATFPYVSPAVQLPTIPSRRVVDAAYYDNYGIAVAIAYLQQDDIMHWIKGCTEALIVVQIRAFKEDVLTDQPAASTETVAHFGRFDWLAAPLQGAIAARDTTMRFRNDHELTLLRHLYGEKFLQPFLLEPLSSEFATMTWVVSQREFERMQQDVTAVMSGSEIARLKALWNSPAPH